MRRRFGLSLILAVTLLAMIGMKAHAIYVETQLTPRFLEDAWASFTIKAKDIDAFKEFEVTVSPKKGRTLSPVRHALLSLSDGQTTIASIPVEEKKTEDTVTYWFRVSPKLLAWSKFDFGENAYGETKDGKGNTVIIGVPGGAGAWFYLRDFVGTEKH